MLKGLRPLQAGFLPLYTEDSVLAFQGAGHNRSYSWESRIKAGAKQHTFDIINAWEDGDYAQQTARASVPETGEKILFPGTVRIFERQSDGTSKVKVHMFIRQGVP